jgi:membrane-bound serine protease (ClpP class)
MMDEGFVFSVDGKILKEKGELLTLTATEATTQYGQPAIPLLADGITPNAQAILNAKYGINGYELHNFKVTWSEHLAQIMVAAAPLFMGLGMLLLFIEFKTPGFGIFGILGIFCMGLVFVSHYIAGLAEWTGLVLFLSGVLLVLVEIFFLPGIWLGLLIGLALIVGSLIWGTQDIWPGQPLSWDFAFWQRPLENCLGSIMIVFGGLFLLHRFLPKWAIWDRLVLKTHVATPFTPLEKTQAAPTIPAIGSKGRAVTGLYPQGVVEVEGIRCEAHVRQGALDPDSPIIVMGYRDKTLLIDADE